MPLAPFWVIDANISRPATRNFRGYPRYYPASGTSRIGSDLAAPSVSSSPPKVRPFSFAFNGHPRGLFCIAAADLNDDDQRRKRGESWRNDGGIPRLPKAGDEHGTYGGIHDYRKRSPNAPAIIYPPPLFPSPPLSPPSALVATGSRLLASSLEALAEHRATAVGRAPGPLGPFRRSRNFLLR